MTHPLWPLLDLRLTTGDLELRIPREEELPAFADVIERGIHPADEMPSRRRASLGGRRRARRSAFRRHAG